MRKVERERLVRERRVWSSVWAWVRMERVVSEMDWVVVLVCAIIDCRRLSIAGWECYEPCILGFG